MGHSDFRSSSLRSTSKLLLCVYNLDRPFRWFSMSTLFSSFELAFLSFFTLFSFTNWINPNYYHFMNKISYEYYPKLKQEVPIALEYDNWLAWKGKKCSLVSVLTRFCIKEKKWFYIFLKSLWFHKKICQNLVCEWSKVSKISRQTEARYYAFIILSIISSKRNSVQNCSRLELPAILFPPFDKDNLNVSSWAWAI